jgi:hypothetical protein
LSWDESKVSFDSDDESEEENQESNVSSRPRRTEVVDEDGWTTVVKK